MNARQRALLEPAFLLHHRPWSDTSRMLELVTRDHGRLTLFARGARRANSALRAVLLPFQPILVSWSGRADGGNLVSAELDGVPAPLPPARTLSAFYLSELMLRLTPRDEGQPEIFAAYASAIAALKSASAEEPVLRLFERLPYAEIAAVAGLAVPPVMHRIAALRERIEQSGREGKAA